ncbi:MAG: nucleotidyltransferase family protein [Bacteroidetes bacterium]|nr:nucleotidyltransferase family protein [Bacteroidota bacterium]MBU1422855.1 nucleotidyltransferase family protein [Bacteroidota bacterium]MBU2472087.1 nucleotidyltransferase family protein [Bacteroidota bacterium]MBU2636653.1 nucleotidyltransferase family protein [Bacteroidota bacterium]
MDTKTLLRLLNEHDVKYVVIGAAAFPAHGYSRTTQDIDILIDSSEENLKKVRAALSAFGYDLIDITDEDLKTKKVLIRQYLVETDIHPFVKGVTFDEVWERKIETKIEDVKFFVASIDDLISMKKAAGRGKDLDDIRVLEKLKNI